MNYPYYRDKLARFSHKKYPSESDDASESKKDDDHFSNLNFEVPDLSSRDGMTEAESCDGSVPASTAKVGRDYEFLFARFNHRNYSAKRDLGNEYDEKFSKLSLEVPGVSCSNSTKCNSKEENHYRPMRPNTGPNIHRDVKTDNDYLFSGHENTDASLLHPVSGFFSKEKAYQPRTSTGRLNYKTYFSERDKDSGNEECDKKSSKLSFEVLDPFAEFVSKKQTYQQRTSSASVFSTRKSEPEETYLKKTASLFQEPVGTGSLLVASIDFGTTYSSWAYSFKDTFEKEPTKVFAKVWFGQKQSQKGPTCVLIKPDGKTLHSFGSEAETTYAQFAEEQKHNGWYFFKNFKMTLFDKMRLDRDVMLEDITGRRLPAMTIFSLSIKYLREDLLSTSKQTLLDEDALTDNDVHWVLTVPAIWTDAAKQFMRESAQKAGIPKHKLTICLEPEAASLYCRHLPVSKTNGEEEVSLGSFKAGTKYLVVDAGGGTVDTTVHEVVNKNTIREVYTASGGAWGGTEVDKAFENFLKEMLGNHVLQKFKDGHMEDYIELFKDFEIKKKETTLYSDGKTTIRIPLTLLEIVRKLSGQTFEERSKGSKHSKQLTVTSDKMRMGADLMRAFFENAIGRICQHVQSLLQKPALSDCTAIVLVGGFSESKLLQESIRQSFRHLKIIIPNEAGLAVLKGAVIFGHAPLAISERVSKFTYGRSMTHLTSPHCRHPRGRQELDCYGEMRCYDNFIVHARQGQVVRIGEATKPIVGYPVYDFQDAIRYEIYASTDLNPQLVTEPSCKRIGSFEVPITGDLPVKNRKFETSFKFGGTEIEVKVVDKATGETTIQHVDFLG